MDPGTSRAFNKLRCRSEDVTAVLYDLTGPGVYPAPSCSRDELRNGMIGAVYVMTTMHQGSMGKRERLRVARSARIGVPVYKCKGPSKRKVHVVNANVNALGGIITDERSWTVYLG